jgi:cytochrome P450
MGRVAELPRDWLAYLTRIARQYGDISYFRVFDLPFCLLVHPTDIESAVVAEHDNVTKAEDYHVLRRLLGCALLTSHGEAWRHHQSLIEPAFHHEYVEVYRQSIVTQTECMLETWKDREPYDIHQEMSRLTSDVMARVLFDLDPSPITDRIREALDIVVESLVAQANLALLTSDQWPMPALSRTQRAMRVLEDIIDGIICERRRCGYESIDILSLLAGVQSPDGRFLSDAELRDVLITLLLAGNEATATALSWVFYLLARHPTVQLKLLRELAQLPTVSSLVESDLPKLKYAQAVVQESIRLYPPVWSTGRQALRDVRIRSYCIPAGTHLLASQWITHRDARFFSEPERFDPDRWREHQLKVNTLPRFAYFPFSDLPGQGGASLAMMVATLILATTIRRFHFDLLSDQEIEPSPSVTLRPKGGIRLEVRKRLSCGL